MDLELRGWRSCSEAGIPGGDTGPGDIARGDTAEDTAKARTVKEEDIGRHDPGPAEEGRKMADTKGLLAKGSKRRPAEVHIQDKQPAPLGRSKDGCDPGGLDHPDHDRWDPTLLSKTR